MHQNEAALIFYNIKFAQFCIHIYYMPYSELWIIERKKAGNSPYANTIFNQIN